MAYDLEKLTEIGWAAIVGDDIAARCTQASIVRGDLSIAILAVLKFVQKPHEQSEKGSH